MLPAFYAAAAKARDGGLRHRVALGQLHIQQRGAAADHGALRQLRDDRQAELQLARAAARRRQAELEQLRRRAATHAAREAHTKTAATAPRADTTPARQQGGAGGEPQSGAGGGGRRGRENEALVDAAEAALATAERELSAAERHLREAVQKLDRAEQDAAAADAEALASEREAAAAAEQARREFELLGMRKEEGSQRLAAASAALWAQEGREIRALLRAKVRGQLPPDVLALATPSPFPTGV